MSRLTITSNTQGFQMNVLAFTSPIYGSISSAQTHREAIHFPIKVVQPEIQFDVIFRGEKEFEDFQKFVRNHQQNTLVTTSLVTLNWQARNILNWTGLIKQFKAGGARWNFTPQARFVVELVNSMVSSRTDFASTTLGWRSIYGGFGPVGSELALPTASEAQILADQYGQNIFNRGVAIAPGVVPTPNAAIPTVPAPPGTNITTGSGAT